MLVTNKRKKKKKLVNKEPEAVYFRHKYIHCKRMAKCDIQLMFILV